MRARDLRAAGIAAPTIARAAKSGAIIRAARGLYQLPDSELDIVRFRSPYLEYGIEHHVISGIDVPIRPGQPVLSGCPGPRCHFVAHLVRCLIQHSVCRDAYAEYVT